MLVSGRVTSGIPNKLNNFTFSRAQQHPGWCLFTKQRYPKNSTSKPQGARVNRAVVFFDAPDATKKNVGLTNHLKKNELKNHCQPAWCFMHRNSHEKTPFGFHRTAQISPMRSQPTERVGRSSVACPLGRRCKQLSFMASQPTPPNVPPPN